jgi:hypothetical protein
MTSPILGPGKVSEAIAESDAAKKAGVETWELKFPKGCKDEKKQPICVGDSLSVNSKVASRRRTPTKREVD